MIRSLDALVRDGKVPGNLMPDFISLDTQGSELDIFMGGRRRSAIIASPGN